MTPACSIPPTMTQHGNARRGGGMRLPAAFHGPDSCRCKKQKHRKDKARWWHERGGGRRGGDYGLEWEKLEIVQQVQKVKAGKWRERSRGAILVGWTPVLFPWSVQTQNHRSSCSHTVLPSSYIRHIPLLLRQGSQRELEGHDEIGVKVNLKASDQGH